MMQELVINTLYVCTSLLAWLILGLTLFALHWQYRQVKRPIEMAGKRLNRAFLGLCAVFILNVWLSSPVPAILFNVLIFSLGSYLFHRSSFHPFLKRKVAAYIFPSVQNDPSTPVFFDWKDKPVDHNEEKEADLTEKVVLLSAEKIKMIHKVLDAPEFLYNPDISLNQLAQSAATNCTYLSRYFNCQLGVSFPEYIMNSRLDKAEELLMHTDMKVVDILEKVGFQNSSTFYQAFNDRHQLTPLQWRKQAR